VHRRRGLIDALPDSDATLEDRRAELQELEEGIVAARGELRERVERSLAVLADAQGSHRELALGVIRARERAVQVAADAQGETGED